jgi:hypothetical protein
MLADGISRVIERSRLNDGSGLINSLLCCSDLARHEVVLSGVDLFDLLNN